MIIRPGTVDDIPYALRVIELFHDEALAEFGFMCTVEKLTEMIHKCEGTWLLAVENGIIVGIIAGMIVTSATSDEPTFQEVMWYVTPEHRRCGMQLYAEMEKLCRDRGVKKMVMVHMNNDIGKKVGEVYKKMGYREFERHFIKEL